MESLTPLLVTLTVTAALAVGGWRRWRSWQRAARKLGMDFDSGFLMIAPSIAGSSGGFEIKISSRDQREAPQGKGSVVTEVVDPQKRIRSDLTLGGEPLLSLFLKPDIQIGERRFDDKVRVIGSELTAFAVLDHRTRGILLGDHAPVSVVLKDGQISSRWSDVEQAAGAVPILVELAQRLTLTDDEIAEHLAKNVAEHANSPAFRLRNLELLAEHFAGSPAVHRAGHSALRAKEPELRLAAAVTLGDAGLAEVHAIAVDIGVELELRLRAVQLLARPDSAAEASHLLQDLLDTEPPLLRLEVIAGLGRRRHLPALPRLEEMAETAGGDTAETIARALGEMDAPAVEPCLVALLSRRDAKTRAAAAEALGQVGSLAAVESLLELTRFPNQRWLQEIGRTAIDRIQARHAADGEHGQLSLTALGEHGGALSSPPDSDGDGGLSLEQESDSGEN